MARWTRFILLALSIASCGEDPPPSSPLPSPPPPPAPIAASRPIASPAAFALVPSGEGALLAWGAPYSAGGGVRALPLGPLGEAAGAEIAIGARATGSPENASHVVELDATAVGRRVGLGWIVEHQDSLHAQSSFSLDAGRTFATPAELGPTVRLARGERGRVSMAGSEDGTLVLYHRIPEAACLTGPGTCARFTRSRVGADAAQLPDGNERREVQRPCEPFVSGASWRAGTWYHAVCHEDVAPRATLFAIRPGVAYAASVEGPEGCRPAGIAPLDEGVAVLMRCGDRDEALHLDEMGRELARLATVERTATCSEGRPLLALARGSTRLVLHLRASTDHVEPLLPEAIAPAGSRAIWTGEALLVAVPIDRDVSLRRYQCVGADRFDRTDVR